MTVHLRQPRISKRSRTGRDAGPVATAVLSAARRPAEAASRDRRADGPEDRALYHCQCGYAFQAAVSTSVGCPHCGSAQAW